MIRKLVSYRNKELGFYECLKPVDNLSNQDIKGSCQRYLKMCPVNECPACVGRQIEIIGEFDDEKGIIGYESPIVLVDCDTILKDRFPQLYEQGSPTISTNEN